MNKIFVESDTFGEPDLNGFHIYDLLTDHQIQMIEDVDGHEGWEWSVDGFTVDLSPKIESMIVESIRLFESGLGFNKTSFQLGADLQPPITIHITMTDFMKKKSFGLIRDVSFFTIEKPLSQDQYGGFTINLERDHYRGRMDEFVIYFNFQYHDQHKEIHSIESYFLDRPFVEIFKRKMKIKSIIDK